VNFRVLEKSIWVLEKSWKFVSEKGYKPCATPRWVGQRSYCPIYSVSILTTCFKDSKTKSNKARKEIPKKLAGGKSKGKCAPDQGSGATLGVLGYPN